MTKLDAIKKSPFSIQNNAKNASKRYNQLFQHAGRAPVFCKITKKKSADGKVTKKLFRRPRLLDSHAYFIAASGAAANAANVFEEECKTLREEPELESRSAPAMIQFSKGAKIVLEQFLVACAQDATMKSHAIREGCGDSKRLKANQMQLGWKYVMSNTGLSGRIPKNIYITPFEAKKSKKKRKMTDAGSKDEEQEADYDPREEADETDYDGTGDPNTGDPNKVDDEEE